MTYAKDVEIPKTANFPGKAAFDLVPSYRQIGAFGQPVTLFRP